MKDFLRGLIRSKERVINLEEEQEYWTAVVYQLKKYFSTGITEVKITFDIGKPGELHVCSGDDYFIYWYDGEHFMLIEPETKENN